MCDCDSETDRVIHEAWIEKALELATNSWQDGEVPVGCLFVYNNQIIGRGRNQTNATKNATKHAEVIAIDEVIEWCKNKELKSEEVFNNSICYVTVEPCIMCAAMLRLVKCSKIYFGCRNERFGGCGSVYNIATDEISTLGECLDVRENYYADRAINLLKLFYKGENPNAPNPKKKQNRT